jgi:hypothetical protein
VTLAVGTLWNLVRALDVCAGDLLYVQTSFSRMRHLGLNGYEFIHALLDYLGPSGTLVMPSFAWNLDASARPWKGYADYFQTRPVFDVRQTPANIGWIPEIFRRLPGTSRGVSYFWSVCAHGPLASRITADQEGVVHPYGPGSSFDALRQYGVKLLGLGVSLNTTSLAPIVDYCLGDSHTQQVFTSEPQVGRVINHAGEARDTRTFSLQPELVRLIKPSVLIARSPAVQSALRRVDHDGIIQFCYPYSIYHAEALRLGQAACHKGLPVPWLEDYPLRVPVTAPTSVSDGDRL